MKLSIILFTKDKILPAKYGDRQIMRMVINKAINIVYILWRKRSQPESKLHKNIQISRSSEAKDNQAYDGVTIF